MSLTRSIALAITDYDDPRSFGSRMRARRVAPLKAMIESVFALHGHVDIIDIGGNEKYWNILGPDYLHAHAVKLTIVNPASFELSPDNGPFTFQIGDGCDLSGIETRAFHIAHSNSVIEHVGDWARMKRFAAEMRRVSERQFVQTPNFWFPMEPHCMTPLFHWLPKPMRVWLVQHFQLGHWPRATTVDEAVDTVESARLINKPMMRSLFSNCTIVTERMLLLPKSIIAFTE
jgi:hypothetical protein